MEATISGILAAFAASIGKISLSVDSLLVHGFMQKCKNSEYYAFCDSVEYMIRGVLFVSMLLCNTLMMTYFVSALEKTPSSLSVTAIVTSVNFVLTGWIGIFFFGEVVSTTWYTGALVTCCGAILIAVSQTRRKIDS